MGAVRHETTKWGEDRYHAVATLKGRQVLLGWYTTERRAQKAVDKAESS